MARVWYWVLLSRGFQCTFSSKTASKALDRDLGLVFHMGQHAHFLCARDRVQPPLGHGTDSLALVHSIIIILLFGDVVSSSHALMHCMPV